jgi:hypothetical protein
LAIECTATSATAVGSLVCGVGSVAFNNSCVNCEATSTGASAGAKTCTASDASTVEVQDC